MKENERKMNIAWFLCIRRENTTDVGSIFSIDFYTWFLQKTVSLEFFIYLNMKTEQEN